MSRRLSARLAVVCGGESGWPPGGPGAVAWPGGDLRDHALALAREFDPEPLIERVPDETGPRAAWRAAARALRVAGGPVVLIAAELPLTPRVWVDYLRRLALVNWPAGGRADGSPAAVLPLTERGPEPGAALFHPDALASIEAALLTAWDGRSLPPGLEALQIEPREWRPMAGPDGLRRCADAQDVGRALALASVDEMEGGGLTHLDADGAPRLVDVGDKPVTRREATAAGAINLGATAFAALTGGRLPKGDALVTARLAAIQAVKRTWEAIPLCHPLPVDAVEVDWAADAAACALSVRVTVRAAARTGVEMEALHGTAVFLLTVYDMAKAVDRSMTITDLRLLAKSGGRGGDYRRATAPAAGPAAGGKEPA